MRDDILTYLIKKVQEEQKIVEQSMVLGAAKDYGEYKYSCGVYRGLMIANNILIELDDRMKDDE